MIKTLARSIREYKKNAILTPILVIVEVVLECIIPFVIANLVNEMQAGCGMDAILSITASSLVGNGRFCRWSSALLLVTPAPRPLRDLPATCGKTCFTASRTIRLKTLTNFPCPALSHV